MPAAEGAGRDRRRLARDAALGFAVALAPLAAPARAAADAPPLVAHWAPIVYHDVSGTPSGGYRNDYLTRFDFDGDWIATNNKASLDSGQHPLLGAVYYAVIETATHAFITYAFFHPFDQASWLEAPAAGSLCDAHENDVEGVIVTIQKDGSPFGAFRAMATEAHGQVYYFKLPGSDVGIGSAYYDNDPLCFCPPVDSIAFFPTPSGHAVAVFIESDGHGVGKQYRALQKSASGGIVLGGERYRFRGSDGVIYFHDGGAAEEPSGAAVDSVRYELRPLDELWGRRHDGGGAPYCDFEDYVGPAGRDCRLDSLAMSFGGECVVGIGGCDANPPWGWDSDHSGLPRGAWFFDPAWAVTRHLAALPDSAAAGFFDYTSNRYLQGDKSLDLSQPSGGAEWFSGDTIPIVWAASTGGQGPAMAPTLRIELSRNGGAWETIDGAVPVAGGSYDWIVTPPAADSCRVRIVAGTDCFLEIADVSDAFAILPDPTVVAGRGEPAFRLHAARPNPLTSATTIAYELAIASPVRLAVYDAVGRRVATLVDEPLQRAGVHECAWAARDDDGRRARSGVYFYHLAAGDFRDTGRLVLLR
jgi:hypothetical protein